MPHKPDKFGIKFWIAVDVESKYILNVIPYLGKNNSCPSTQGPSDKIDITFMQPFVSKGRNVATDNFFTSFLFAKKLKKRKPP